MRLSLIFLTAAMAGCAWADDLVWKDPNGTIWSNFYTSPYYAYDESTNPVQVLTLFCLDYNHEIAPPNSWQANLNPLSASNVSDYQFSGAYPGALSTPWAFTGDSASAGDPHAVTMLPGSDNYHRYLEASWLFSNILTAQSKSDTNTMVLSQVAAWDLFVDSNHVADLESRIAGTGGTWAFDNYVGAQSGISGLSFRDAVDEAVKAAQNAVLGGWTPSIAWTVVTANLNWVQNNNNGILAQEFLTPYNVAPEPSSQLLLGTILLVGAMLALRKRRLDQRFLSK